MDIHECHDRYGITLKKLRRMQRDGILKIEKDKTPEYWRRVISDIAKGKMSARSIALAFRFPEKLDRISSLTRTQRLIIESHFKSVELPDFDRALRVRSTITVGMVEKHPMLSAEFIGTVQRIIPSRYVSYYYVAVRLYLACETDFHIDLMSKYMTRAFSSARDEPAMQGWWHREPGPYEKKHVIYHRPRHYDL